jgi:hypothetical protein
VIVAKPFYSNDRWLIYHTANLWWPLSTWVSMLELELMQVPALSRDAEGTLPQMEQAPNSVVRIGGALRADRVGACADGKQMLLGEARQREQVQVQGVQIARTHSNHEQMLSGNVPVTERMQMPMQGMQVERVHTEGQISSGKTIQTGLMQS